MMNIRISDALQPGTLGPSRPEARAMHAHEVRNTIVRAVLTVVLAVLASAGLFYSIVESVKAYSLAQDYRTVEAHVIQTQCASHLQVVYAFEAGGATYSGSGMAHKRCDAYHIGDALTVYYAPADPNSSLNEVKPAQEWHTRLALVATELGVIAVMGLMLALHKGN